MQNVTQPFAEVLRCTWKEDAVSNVFVTVFVFASGPAETCTSATKPFASEGRALIPVADMVPEQPTDPPAPEMGTLFSVQFQDTPPEALPLQSKLHEPDAWAAAGTMANVESARSARANTAEVVRRVRTPANLLRIAVVPLPEPRKVDGASPRMKVGRPEGSDSRNASPEPKRCRPSAAARPFGVLPPCTPVVCRAISFLTPFRVCVARVYTYTIYIVSVSYTTTKTECEARVDP